jgi:hypothetical protein
MALFYCWTAASAAPLALTGDRGNPYNELANAFLHLRLSVGVAPARLLRLANPYDPVQNTAIQIGAGIHDFALYRGRLYLTWGPVPGLLLAPMCLLGLEPSEGLVTLIFSLIGFGFVLATLSTILKQLGNRAIWTCVLAAVTLGLASAVPFMLRRPEVYEEEISSGFCFAMVGVWLAVSTVAKRRASWWRVAATSLCFGLAMGARIDLVFTGALLIPAYLSLRATVPRRPLLVAVIVPVVTCLVLLMAYNQVRFGDPLEIGGRYQLAGYDPRTMHFGELGYVPPGLWFYLISPPRPTILFPFIELTPPPVFYPFTLPAHYAELLEVTGGLLPMTPILVFLVALPWLWRRRRGRLGSLAMPLMLWVGAALAVIVFISYEFFSTTERYEVDFLTPLLLGAVAAWLALAERPNGQVYRIVRAGGAILAIWSCATGLAISFVGYDDSLRQFHPLIWRGLEAVGSPLSTLIAHVVGHPVLGGVVARELTQSGVNYATLGAGTTSFEIVGNEGAAITVVSPSKRTAILVAGIQPALALRGKPTYRVELRGSGTTSLRAIVSPLGSTVALPVQLAEGINRFVLRSLAPSVSATAGLGRAPRLLVSGLAITDGQD